MKTISREGKTKSLLLDVRRITAYLMGVALCVMFITSSLGGVLSSTTESTSEMTTGLADSPWPKFRGDVRNTGLSPYDTSHADGTELWRFGTEGNVTSSPVVGADGTIYVGSHRNVYAINQDGTEKWNFWTGGIMRTSPAVGADGTIYVCNAYVRALNPDGSEKWRFTYNEQEIYLSPTIGPDDTIYVVSREASVGWGVSTNLHALNPDGSEKWRFTTAGTWFWAFNGFFSPAIGEDGTIYFGSIGSRIYAVDPDGTEKWNFDTGGMLYSSPAVGEDGTIYIGSADQNVYAINPDGSEKWTFNTDGDVTSSPAIGEDGTIYIGSADQNVYAINPDGTEKWRYETDGAVHSSPAVGEDGTIYIGSVDQNVYAINSDGTEKWRFNTDGNVTSSPAIGKWGIIYIGSQDNNLYALGPATLPEPVISDESPSEGATDVPINTTLSAYIEAGVYPAAVEFYLDGDLVYSEMFNTDRIVETEPLTLDFDTTYDWEVVVENDEGVVTNETYSFTTVEPIQLTIHAGEGGTTVPEPGIYNHVYGDTVDVVANPDEGWYFSHWSGDVPVYEEYNENITIFMDDNKTLTAHFDEIIPPTVNITSFDDGTVFDTDEVTVEWEAVEGTYSIDRYELRLNDGEWIDVGTDTRYTFEDLEDGEYNVTVRVVDSEGDYCVESANFTVDTGWGQLWILPVIAIVVVLLALVLYLTKDRWLETRLTEGEGKEDIELEEDDLESLGDQNEV